jgi:hypothetical protein
MRSTVTYDESVLGEPVELTRVPAFDGQGSKGDLKGWMHDEVLPSVLDFRGRWILGRIPKVEKERLRLFAGWVNGMPKEERFRVGDAFPERRLDGDGSVAAGKEAIPKSLEACANVRLFTTQSVDSKDDARDEPREYTWWVRRHRWDV